MMVPGDTAHQLLEVQDLCFYVFEGISRAEGVNEGIFSVHRRGGRVHKHREWYELISCPLSRISVNLFLLGCRGEDQTLYTLR